MAPRPRSAAAGVSADGASAEAELRTFLIADIRGYTTYTTDHGADAAAKLATDFAAIVREVVTAHDGFLLELRGDEALVVFVLARRALRAALELQTRFAAELPRGVGIGLDAGEAIPVEGGYRGSALNLAARLCGQAGPGETLASEAVIHLAAKVDGIGYADPRTFRLKGMDEPIRAVHVVPSAQGSRKPIRYGRDGGVDRRLLAVGGVGLLAVVIAAASLSGAFGGTPAPSSSPAASAAGVSPSPAASPELFSVDQLPLLAFVDPKTGTVTDSRTTESLLVDGGQTDDAVWLLAVDPLAIEKIDPITHKLLKTFSIPLTKMGGATIADGILWVSDATGPVVIGIDIATGVKKHEYHFGADEHDVTRAVSLTSLDGSLWVGSADTSEVLRMDPATGAIQARIPMQFPDILQADPSGVYVTGFGQLRRIDPATNTVAWATDIRPTFLPDIAFGGGFIWTVDDASGHVWKVQPTGQIADDYDVGVGALPMAAVGDTMWVGVQDTGTLVGINMVTGATRSIHIGHLIYTISKAGDDLAVTLGPTPEEVIAAVDGDVLTIASPFGPFQSSDPATSSAFEWRQMSYLTCVGLMRYQDAPAPDGWNLIPEVASAAPTISPDGLTYTYAVRDGFMFSPPSTEAITAATFQASLERALSPAMGGFTGYTSGFLHMLDGLDAYRNGDAAHISGITVTDDTISFRLIEPTADFPNRLTLPYFCPVPVGTPTVVDGLDTAPPLPSAGPYFFETLIGGELALFVKNPNYHGDRPTPFDAIAFRTGFEPGDAIGRVDAGTADAATAGAYDRLANAASQLAKTWGEGSQNATNGDQRWFGSPRFQTRYIALNTNIPALKDPTIREAISKAIDRQRLSALFGTAPAPILLPPSVPEGRTTAAVPARDLEGAKALMAGRKVELVMQITPKGDIVELDAITTEIVSELSQIGITVTVQRSDDPTADAHADGSTIGLIEGVLDSDFPSAVDLLGALDFFAWLTPADSAELARIHGLDRDEGSRAAIALATKVDATEHLVIPYGYPVYPMFLGPHVGCGFVQPAIGAVDLSSLCRKP